MKKLSKLMESIWSDMQDRSAGETIRKEDDIDLLDETGLVKYMEKVYMSPNDGTHIVGDTLNRGSIFASLFDVDGRYYSIIYKSISTNKPEITFPVCKESDIENKLSKLYKVTRLKQYNNQIYKIEPNDGSKITNKFFIEIFDFILDNVEDGINNINKILFKKANESIWSDIQDRSAGEVRRKEDGVTSQDIEQRVGILNTRDKAYSWEEMKNIRTFEAPYTYLIYDGGYGTDLIAEFCTYDEMKENDDLDDFEDRVIEEDYISICKGIATKLKEIGGGIAFLPRYNEGNFIGKTNEKISDYDGDYVLQLISESDVDYWDMEYREKYGEGSTDTSLDDYKESMIDTFPELDDVVFITWEFNNSNGVNIGIPITATTVKNFKKYKEYTKNWFTVDEEAE